RVALGERLGQLGGERVTLGSGCHRPVRTVDLSDAGDHERASVQEILRPLVALGQKRRCLALAARGERQMFLVDSPVVGRGVKLRDRRSGSLTLGGSLVRIARLRGHPPALAVILRVLILWAVIALAVALSVLAHRRRKSDESHEYQVVLGFVGSAYGLLLGLLVVFAVGHYSDTRREAQKEASSLVALWDTLDVYPPATRHPVQHDLICYMRAIVTDDWPAMERGSRLEDPRTLAFGDRVRAGVRGLPVGDEHQGSAYGRASTFITDAGESRQQLLFFTEPEVPTVLWVLIYVGALLLVFLVGTHYAERPRGRAVALGSVASLLTVIVVVLSMLDNPFAIGARVHPDSMRDGIDLLSVGRERTGVFRPCPQKPPP